MKDVVGELLFAHQQRVAVFPRHIQQMSIAVNADVVSVGLQALHHIGMAANVFAGEEERCLYTQFLQRRGDELGAVVAVVGGEHKADLFLCRVGHYNAAVAVYVAVGGGSGLLGAFNLIGRQWEGERSCSVHCGFVGAIIVHIVVIHHIVHLKIVVVVWFVAVAHVAHEVHAAQALEDAAINRTVNQAAGGVAHFFKHKAGVGLARVVAAHWQLNNHAHAPRVAAKQPVAQRAFHFFELAVAR